MFTTHVFFSCPYLARMLDLQLLLLPLFLLLLLLPLLLLLRLILLRCGQRGGQCISPYTPKKLASC